MHSKVYFKKYNKTSILNNLCNLVVKNFKNLNELCYENYLFEKKVVKTLILINNNIIKKNVINEATKTDINFSSFIKNRKKVKKKKAMVLIIKKKTDKTNDF